MNDLDEMTPRNWAHLRHAGAVDPPTTEVLENALAVYRQRVGNAPSGRPVVHAWPSIGAIAAALTVGAALLVPAVRSALGPDDEAPRVAAAAPRSSSDAPVADSSPSPVLTVDVKGQASLIRPFFLPSFEEFLQSGVVTSVVVGKVQSTATAVERSGALEALTRVDVLVEAGEPATMGDTLTATETGGIVPVSMVRSELEQKLGRDLTREEAMGSVDLRVDGRNAAQDGDQVLLALGGSSTDGFYVLARLTRNDAGTEYQWAGERPNDGWVEAVPAAQVEDLAR